MLYIYVADRLFWGGAGETEKTPGTTVWSLWETCHGARRNVGRSNQIAAITWHHQWLVITSDIKLSPAILVTNNCKKNYYCLRLMEESGIIWE